MAKVGRNDDCPCGSGKKFKKCCEGAEQRRSNTMLFLVGGAVLGALLLGILQFAGDREATGPNRVWDAAHGHYHDVP
jgi:SEC-C motif